MNKILEKILLDNGFDHLSDLLRPLAYFLTAMLCMYFGMFKNAMQHTSHQMQELYFCLCPMYLMAASSALVHGDDLWLNFARSFAQENSIYSNRRVFQLVTLLLIGWIAVMAWKKYQCNRYYLSGINMQHSMLIMGASGSLVLHLLRYVSFHYTDSVLNAVWLDFSVATWLECASLGLILVASILEYINVVHV